MSIVAGTWPVRFGAFCLAALACGGCDGGPTRSHSKNLAPVANAGIAQSVTTGGQVLLDGAASSDPDGDPITCLWTLTTRPDGSTAALSSATSTRPAFTADVAGTYMAMLVVNDGRVDSAPATVIVTAVLAQVAPSADAGRTQTVVVPTLVTLDGSASSDANGDPLLYGWRLVGKPANSVAVLAAPDSVKPTFTADVAGFYVARLIVNDGRADSAPASATVTATITTPGQGTWETSLEPRDIDGDGAIDAYFDTTRDITWLADANAAAGTPYDSVPQLPGDEPSTGADGLLYRIDAARWVTQLNVHGVLGWRLPTTADAAASEAFPPPSQSSEMASMYYATLGNGPSPGVTPDNPGPFANLKPASYWSQTAYSLLPGYPDPLCWSFDFSTGRQGGAICSQDRYLGHGHAYAAWAVHDGDVPNAEVR